MVTVSLRFDDMSKAIIPLGYVGENKHRRILFDCKKMFEDYPTAIPVLAVTPPKGDTYPGTVTREGNTVIWDITDSDVVVHGNGMVQLSFTVDDIVAKSAICKTRVSISNSPTGSVPTGIEDWLIRAEELLTEIPNEIDAALEEAKTSGLFDGVGISSIGYVGTVGKVNTYRVNLTDGSHYDFTVENGDDGVGIASIAKTGTAGLVDTYTITLTNNQTYTFTVTNGENGVQIDDTTPALNKVFSSKKVDDELTDVKNAIDLITDTHISNNLYDKTACDPADGKAYWDGSRNTAATYATTGKIPVEAETQYVFYAGGTNVKYVEYFSGETGSTFLSRLTINNEAFTTPAGCTYVAIMLFAATHTTEQYEAAMAVAQLNKGSTVQPYEPYGNSVFVPLDAVEDGDKLSSVSSATVIQSQINLYDKSLATDQQSIYQNERVTNAKQANTGLIPVEPNTQYCLSRDPSTPLNIVAKVWEFNASRQYTGFLQTELGNYSRNYSISFKTSATTKFIGINMELDPHTTQNFKDTIDSLMLCYGTQRPAEYSAYNPETVLLASRISNAFYANADRFKGKRWLALGTSVTWYDSCKYQSGLHTGEVCRGYVGNVARRKPLSVFNNGIAGSTLGNVDANSLINRYQNISWNDYDIVTIEFGINDFGYDIPVGSESDAAGTNTFAACLRTVIEYAMSQNHKLNIVICTEPDVRGSQQNNNNNTLSDYADITIAIAKKYRLPVCDWFYHSGINNWNRGNTSYDYLTADGTHPNNEGHMRMGAMLNQVFDSLLC